MNFKIQIFRLFTFSSFNSYNCRTVESTTKLRILYNSRWTQYTVTVSLRVLACRTIELEDVGFWGSVLLFRFCSNKTNIFKELHIYSLLTSTFTRRYSKCSPPLSEGTAIFRTRTYFPIGRASESSTSVGLDSTPSERLFLRYRLLHQGKRQKFKKTH